MIPSDGIRDIREWRSHLEFDGVSVQDDVMLQNHQNSEAV